MSYFFQQMMNALASRPSVLRQSLSVLLFEFSMVTLRMGGDKRVRVRRDAVSVPQHTAKVSYSSSIEVGG